MKVRDLIAALEDMPLDMEVEFSYDYGDHWHNVVSKPVKSIGTMYVVYSEYHRSNKLASDDEIANETTKEVVILQ